MPRITIHQFRDILATRAGTASAVRAYRELSCRPELAAAMRAVDWVSWPPAAARCTAA